jgi:hypothetical protein
MGLENNKFEGTFSIITSDGLIRVKVPEGTPKAKLCEYELSDGSKGSKWELEFTEVSGRITAIKFLEAQFGKVMNVNIVDKGEVIALSLQVASNFCEDLMKKLPGIDFSKVVTLKPYSFEDKKTGKPKKGVTVTQDGEKIPNFFVEVGEDGRGKAVNGFPEVEDKKYDKDDWKIYFMQVRKFLMNYAEVNVFPKLVPFAEQVGGQVVEDVEIDDVDVVIDDIKVDGDIKPEAIPFD